MVDYKKINSSLRGQAFLDHVTDVCVGSTDWRRAAWRKPSAGAYAQADTSKKPQPTKKPAMSATVTDGHKAAVRQHLQVIGGSADLEAKFLADMEHAAKIGRLPTAPSVAEQLAGIPESNWVRRNDGSVDIRATKHVAKLWPGLPPAA